MENEEELSAEELQELMSCYKKELAHIYRTASAKRAAAMKRDTFHRNTLLRQCDEDMRSDIDPEVDITFTIVYISYISLWIISSAG